MNASRGDGRGRVSAASAAVVGVFLGPGAITFADGDSVVLTGVSVLATGTLAFVVGTLALVAARELT